ncbi:MAG: hypothetical protein O7A64_01435, partial [Alphaproteobacteria bacterium]|nr:hypothetical protein [Alphaproteobacteria bacterium]
MKQHLHRIFVIGVLVVAMAVGGAVVSSAAEWGPPDSGQWAPVELAQLELGRSSAVEWGLPDSDELAPVELAQLELALAKPKPMAAAENDVNDPLEAMNR